MLKAEISKEISQAFDTDLSDAIKPFTIVQRVVDADTDWLSNRVPTVDEYATSSRGVFGDYSEAEIDGINILRTDTKLLCLATELNSPTPPKVGDTINGMEIVSVGKDPADVTWVLQLRRV